MKVYIYDNIRSGECKKVTTILAGKSFAVLDTDGDWMYDNDDLNDKVFFFELSESQINKLRKKWNEDILL